MLEETLEVDQRGLDSVLQLPLVQEGCCAHYAREPRLAVERKQKWGVPVVVCDFEHGGFPIQVFGQGKVVEQQRAYRHMLIEARLLEMADDEARSAIRALKASGLKTEPTFGRYFDLSGDPYLRLLELAKLDDDEFLCHFDDQREACPERNEGTNPPHDKCVQISGGCLALLDMTY